MVQKSAVLGRALIVRFQRRERLAVRIAEWHQVSPLLPLRARTDFECFTLLAECSSEAVVNVAYRRRKAHR